MDSLLLRLRREAEAVAAAAVADTTALPAAGGGAAGAGGDDVTVSSEGGEGGGMQSKMDEMKDKLIEEFKKCKNFTHVLCVRGSGWNREKGGGEGRYGTEKMGGG